MKPDGYLIRVFKYGLGSSDLILNLVFELLKMGSSLIFHSWLIFLKYPEGIKSIENPKPPGLVLTPRIRGHHHHHHLLLLLLLLLLQICNLQLCAHTRCNRCTHNTSSVPPSPSMRYYSFYNTIEETVILLLLEGIGIMHAIPPVVFLLAAAAASS